MYRRDDIARAASSLPLLAALAFLTLAPSDGATIGGGLLVLAAVPLAALTYLVARPRDPGRRRRWGRPSEW